MRLKYALAVALTMFVPAGLPAGEKPTANELLEQYRKSVEPLDRARVVASYKPLFRVEPRGPAMSLHEATLVRDGTRLKLSEVWTLTTFNDPNRPMERRESQSIGLIVDGVYSHVDVERTANPERPNVSDRREGNDRRLWDRMGPVGLVFGRMDGDGTEPLWKVMSEAATLELEPQTEQINGVETHIVTSRGKYGRHRVWLDPASGTLPRRIEIHKKVGDLWNDEQLGSRRVEEARGRPKKESPTVLRHEMAVRVDNIQIEKKESAFVTTGFDRSIEWTIDKRQGIYARGELRVDTVEFFPDPLPDSVFQFDAKIPNGTLVSVYRKAPITLIDGGPADHEEVWIDGRVQRKPGQ